MLYTHTMSSASHLRDLVNMEVQGQQKLQTRLYQWFMRRTTPSAVRKIGEFPISVGSDIGNVRSENQDRIAVLKVQLECTPPFVVIALCDGMGGMTEGSACASHAIASFFAACIRFHEVPPQKRLELAVLEANNVVHELYHGRGGSTLSALLYNGSGSPYGVNVGDSRIYSYREGKLEQLSVDDTMDGLFHRAENDAHPRNELLQYIGMGNGIEPHTLPKQLLDESLLLSSDGAHYLDKQVMQSIIHNAKEPALAVRRLIELAKWCGGHDNASVAMVSPFVLQSQLFEESGIIQVWDPFGEVQIIAADLFELRDSDNARLREQKTAVESVVEKIAHPVKPLKKKRVSKKKGTDKVISQVVDADNSSDQPPLKIYFKANIDKNDDHT